MAKRSNGFDKDPKRASLAGKKSSRALPPDLKQARALRTVEFEQIIYKYMDKSPAEIKQILTTNKTPDGLTIPAKELIVLKLVQLALENGDLARLNFLLDRTIGSIPKKLEVGDAGGFKKLHDAILAELEKGEK